MSLGLLKKAMKGNVKAFEMIRDTIGQKPAEKLNINNNTQRVMIINDLDDKD